MRTIGIRSLKIFLLFFVGFFILLLITLVQNDRPQTVETGLGLILASGGAAAICTLLIFLVLLIVALHTGNIPRQGEPVIAVSSGVLVLLVFGGTALFCLLWGWHQVQTYRAWPTNTAERLTLGETASQVSGDIKLNVEVVNGQWDCDGIAYNRIDKSAGKTLHSRPARRCSQQYGRCGDIFRSSDLC